MNGEKIASVRSRGYMTLVAFGSHRTLDVSGSETAEP